MDRTRGDMPTKQEIKRQDKAVKEAFAVATNALAIVPSPILVNVFRHAIVTKELFMERVRKQDSNDRSLTFLEEASRWEYVAATACELLKDRNELTLLKSFLKDSEVYVRFWAASWLLGKETEAEPVLEEIAKTHHLLDWSAQRALAEFRSKKG